LAQSLLGGSQGITGDRLGSMYDDTDDEDEEDEWDDDEDDEDDEEWY
jgi:hypothetical protein